MARYALVEGAVVRNTINLEQPGSYTPKPGYVLVEIPDGTLVNPGYTWDGTSFSAPAPPTNAELEEEVQEIADELVETEERMMALAKASVDLRMADITGMTLAEVRSAFRDRIVFHLRARRGI